MNKFTELIAGLQLQRGIPSSSRPRGAKGGKMEGVLRRKSERFIPGLSDSSSVDRTKEQDQHLEDKLQFLAIKMNIQSKVILAYNYGIARDCPVCVPVVVFIIRKS